MGDGFDVGQSTIAVLKRPTPFVWLPQLAASGIPRTSPRKYRDSASPSIFYKRCRRLGYQRARIEAWRADSLDMLDGLFDGEREVRLTCLILWILPMWPTRVMEK